MNEIEKLRNSLSMTTKDFAEHFGIPYNTVRQWVNGERKAPEYVISMLQKLIECKTQGEQICLFTPKKEKYGFSTPNYIVQWNYCNDEHCYAYTTFTEVIRVIRTFNEHIRFRVLTIREFEQDKTERFIRAAKVAKEKESE